MSSKLASSLLLALVISLALPASAQKKGTVSLWLTTPDRTSLLSLQSPALRFGKPAAGLPIIEVNPKQKFQSMDGFGFALTGGSAQLMMRMDAPQRNALLRELFGTGKGDIGVSYLRVSIGSSDMNDHAFTYDDLPAGQTDVDLKKFSLGPDATSVVPVLKQILAINPSIKILGSPWSAPAWMKSNDDLKGGNLLPQYYQAYANYFVKYIQKMRAERIRIDAITPQNEPLNPKNTPSMVMEAMDEARFISQDLGPAFRRAGIRTKIIIYDHNCDRPDYPLAILADPAARQYVDGSGFHLYGGEITAMTKVHDAYPKKNLYFTEQMVVDKPGDPALHIAEPVAQLIVGAPRNWSRNVLLWNLAADPQFGPHTNNGGCPVCEGAITLDGNKVTRNVAYYTVAHASKFVRPGSVRIASSEVGGLADVAFVTPKGKKVLIVANPGDAPVKFAIGYRGKDALTELAAGSVATYIWQ
ncbi:MAG: glycoside hydrolase family 30 protein [Acidobacteriaceae bacterium]